MGVATRLIVEVRTGPTRGQRAVVSAGGVLRVGRTERADLVVDRDPEISGVHFELAWDGATCLLRDLDAARGTRLSGEPFTGEVTVAHGGWIQAGDTSFMVYVEGFSPFRGEPADRALADRARAELAPRVPRLHAVLDAARDERVLELLREAVDESRSLYEGPKGDALADAAPYLVSFRPGSRLLDRLLDEGWGKSWGIFLESRSGFRSLRRHLRRFLMVEEEETGERLYFRFYDPRVLREMLPMATVRQRDDLYADVVDAFLLEDDAGRVRTFAAVTPVTTGEPAHAPRRTESHAQDP